MYKKLLMVICLLGLGMTFCSGRKGDSALRPEDRLALAEELQGEGKCAKAAIEYEQLLSEFPTQQIAERAEFNLARCRLELEEYDLALLGFEDFIDSYPLSELVDNAMYYIALSYLRQAPRPERDQTKTAKALSELNLLLREYPETDVRREAEEAAVTCRSKLAEKEYLNGRLYLRLGYYESARIYFDSVLAEYGETDWAGLALLGSGIAYSKENRLAEAREAFERILREYPSSGASAEAARRLEELGGVVESEARAFSEH
jgi:outer membrane protein assembly factor BamD